MEEISRSQNKTLRVAIVGAGWTLAVHVPAWRMIPNCEVTAVCTAHKETAEAVAHTHGIAKAYGDYKQIAIDPDIDIVIVGTPPNVRYDIIMECLKNGKHVISCLPYATSKEQATAMRNEQVSRRLVGIVETQFTWLPALRYMKDLIEEGWLGDLVQATIELQTPLFGSDESIYPWVSYKSDTQKTHLWLADSKSGASAWRNYGSHSIINLAWLFGEVDEIIGDAHTAVKEWKFPTGQIVKPDTKDTAMALLRLKNGAFANINTSWSAADAMCYRLEAKGTKGRFLITDNAFGEATTSKIYYGSTNERPFTELAGSELDIPSKYFEVEGTSLTKEACPMFIQPVVAMFSDVADAIRTGRESYPSFSLATHAQLAVEAMERSIESGRWEKVEL